MNKNGSDIKNGSNGLEEKLWAAADKLRGHMDAAEYKHVLLGLIFLKYISDAFEETRAVLSGTDSDSEDREEYLARSVFWVPPGARWSFLQTNVNDAAPGKLINAAMAAIEKENPSLKGALPKDYFRSLNKQRLMELIDLIGAMSLGSKESRSKDILGRVYEYFLGRFASVEGKGGEFYTPQSVVKLLVEMVEPYKGLVYDPCCGSGGIFVQSEKFAQAHGGRSGDISIYGQESNPTTWRLCKMNLGIRGIEADIGEQHADTFHNDLHEELKADFILANPPFNVSDWGGEHLKEDIRWRYGIPPAGNANFAWIQHIVHHLSPNGMAGFVLSNGTLSVNQSRGEGELRKTIIEADLVDCIVTLPNQLFYTTQIASCLWFLRRKKNGSGFQDRRGQTLFIRANDFGRMIDRTHRELTDDEIGLIAGAYHVWSNEDGQQEYKDIPGFCKSATIDEIRTHKWALVPGRYVGFDESVSKQCELSLLRAELEEVEARLSRISDTSKFALTTLKEVLGG